MAKHRVGKGFGRISFDEAISRAQAGDVILVAAGDHWIGNIWLRDLDIRGEGDPRQIILRGQLELKGKSRIRNLTLQADPKSSALLVRTADSRIQVFNCVLNGPIAANRPAVYLHSGGLTLEHSTINTYTVADTGETGFGLLVDPNSRLQVEGASLAGVEVRSSNAELKDVRALSLTVKDGGYIASRGVLEMSPAKGMRSLVLAGGSSAHIRNLREYAGVREALCDASSLRIDAVEVPHGEHYRVVKDHGGVVETTAPNVEVTTAQKGPKQVPWPLTDARRFKTAIAPQLNPGDTVVLEAGDYYLEDYDNSTLSIAWNFIGAGEAETVLNGRLLVQGDSEVSVSDLTLNQDDDESNALAVLGGTLNLANVDINAAEASRYPVVLVKWGTLTLDYCAISASADVQRDSIAVAESGRVEASRSALGWLYSMGGQLALENCNALQLWMQEGAQVSSTNGLQIGANGCGKRAVVAESGSQISIDTLTTDAERPDLFVDSSELRIEWLESPENSEVVLTADITSAVSVEGNRVGVSAAQPVTEIATIPAEPDAAQQNDAGTKGTSAPEARAGEPNTADDDDPMSKIRQLTGLSKVKQQAQNFVDKVEYNEKLKAQGHAGHSSTMHSFFLGNPGTGKTTVARLLGETLFKAGALERSVFIEVSRKDLVSTSIGGSAKLVADVVEKALGGVLFIDEAYTLFQKNNNEFAQEAVDELIALMENHRDSLMVILAGYTDRMQDLLSMNVGFESRVRNVFNFEDYTPEELTQIGYSNLERSGFKVDRDLYQRALTIAYQRDTDRSNGRWARNFNDQLIDTAGPRKLKAGDTELEDLTRITKEDLDSAVGGSAREKAANVKALLAELDGMIGLDSVKTWAHDLVGRVEVNEQLREAGKDVSRPSYHMTFTGNPGTGKTTVADIVAGLFYNLGILAKPTVKTVTRSDLVGAVIGATEEKTERVLKEAMGGVLFVDEAYQLTPEGASENDFGKQAVETLLVPLEKYRDKFVTIFAGYTENMDKFLQTNPGLKSRVPEGIEFPDYTPEQVAEIVVAILSKRWEFNAQLVSHVAVEGYKALPREDQANGRSARIFAEKLEAAHLKHIGEQKITGEEADVIADAVVESLLPATAKKTESTEALLQQLDSMIGLDSVKTWAHDLVRRVETNAKLREAGIELEQPTYHMIFDGNPGTGKTTVANIVAGLFHNLGVLPKPVVNDVTASNLIGQHVGETEKNTEKTVKDSLGGVLFIDEAHQLTPDGTQHDFGEKAVKTLLPLLENHRKEFVVVFAGYTHEMNRFLAADPGLESRIPHRITFDDYTPEQVAEIVVAVLSKKNWQFDAERLSRAAAESYAAVEPKKRSNGRWARNFAEKLEAAHIKYIGEEKVTGDEMRVISDSVIKALTPGGVAV